MIASRVPQGGVGGFGDDRVAGGPVPVDEGVHVGDPERTQIDRRGRGRVVEVKGDLRLGTVDDGEGHADVPVGFEGSAEAENLLVVSGGGGHVRAEDGSTFVTQFAHGFASQTVVSPS
jgi:hypothetical protein